MANFRAKIGAKSHTASRKEYKYHCRNMKEKKHATGGRLPLAFSVCTHGPIQCPGMSSLGFARVPCLNEARRSFSAGSFPIFPGRWKKTAARNTSISTSRMNGMNGRTAPEISRNKKTVELVQQQLAADV